LKNYYKNGLLKRITDTEGNQFSFTYILNNSGHVIQKTASGEKFKETTINRRELTPKDVLIEIKYCGVCHSDIHHARGEWGAETYPLVPGHEIAGVVVEVGTEVKKHKVGDHVGVGCMVDSCGECVNCKKGEEQYCLKGNIGTYAKIDKYGERTQGGYSTHIVVTEDFVLKIPESISLDAAAPLFFRIADALNRRRR